MLRATWFAWTGNFGKPFLDLTFFLQGRQRWTTRTKRYQWIAYLGSFILLRRTCGSTSNATRHFSGLLCSLTCQNLGPKGHVGLPGLPGIKNKNFSIIQRIIRATRRKRTARIRWSIWATWYVVLIIFIIYVYWVIRLILSI